MTINTTPNRGYPWPDNTEAVANGWDAIRDVAVAVDTDVQALDTAKSDTGHTHGQYGNARLRAGTAGIQKDGTNNDYISTGVSWDGASTMVQTFTTDGFGNQVPTVPPKAITASNGTIYWNYNQYAQGLVITFVLVDVEP